MAPIWRHYVYMTVCTPVKRPCKNLRLDPDIWVQIDHKREKRAGSVSRNTWITEAILEKLAREEQPDGQNRGENA
jgi:hypothetical protein